MIEEQHPVITGAQFPDVFLQMFSDVFAKPCSVVFKKLNILGNLFMLDSGILISQGFFCKLSRKFQRSEMPSALE